MILKRSPVAKAGCKDDYGEGNPIFGHGPDWILHYGAIWYGDEI
jgi:hypothetical protein